MMPIRAVYSCLVLFLLAHLSVSAVDFDIDFHRDYKKSMSSYLIEKKEYTKAVDFLDQILMEEEDEKNRQYFSALRIVAIGCQKDRAEEALAQVSMVEDKALQGYCRYKILSSHNMLDVLADKYMEEHVSRWPGEFRATGFIIKGKLYEQKLHKKPSAIAEYEKAVADKNLGGFKKISLTLDIARLKEGEDPEAALKCYEEAHEFFQANMSRHLTSNLYNRLIWEWAQLLEKLKEDGELIEVLNKFNGKNPERIKEVLTAKVAAFGRLGDTARQKKYQTYLENFNNHLLEERMISTSD